MTRFLPAFFCAVLAGAAEPAYLDHSGRLGYFVYAGGEELPLRSNLYAQFPGGVRHALFSRADRIAARRGDVSTWSGALNTPNGLALQYSQEARFSGAQTIVKVTLEAQRAPTAELFYAIDLPRAAFAGGAHSSGALAPTRGLDRVVWRGQTDRLRFAAPGEKVVLEAALDAQRAVILEDRWERAGRWYTALVAMKPNAPLTLTFTVTGKPDTAPAALTLDAAQKRFTFQGFGGNYCFNADTPAGHYTLDNLPVRWARTEMKLMDWEPQNDDGDPAHIDWDYFKAQDQEGSRLRGDFLFAQKLAKRGIPTITSIWWLPEWMYVDPHQQPRSMHNRKVAPEMWSELLESVSSYLLYMKQQYGVEPELFSFNEANIGVYVLFTPEEHRTMLKSFGAHFARLGLKTKLLLADATGPAGTHEYALAAASDPEALSYTPAVAFHSWGGATPEQYQAWGDLAEWLRLPLFVTELGVDAAAHQTRSYMSYNYGIRELRMIQELLLYARVQATLYWEYTPDYSLLEMQDGKPVPTARFWFTKQLSELTPRDANALATTSSNAKVLFTAFEKNGQWALHIVNTGPAREATLSGLPPAVAAWRVVRTTETEDFKTAGEVKPTAGTLKLALPARCLVSLAARR